MIIQVMVFWLPTFFKFELFLDLIFFITGETLHLRKKMPPASRKKRGSNDQARNPNTKFKNNNDKETPKGQKAVSNTVSEIKVR
jgi:hypothetical protein